MTIPARERSSAYPTLIRYPDFTGRMSGFLKEIFIARGWIEPAPGNKKVLYVTTEGKKHIKEMGIDGKNNWPV